MQLVVITRENQVDGETDVLNGLFEAGLSGLHLRKPGASTDEMRAILRQIHPDFHGRIFIHGHTALYAEFGLWGVHFPLETLLERGKVDNMGTVSCSAHTYAEVAACRGLTNRLFISPLFDSISKPGYVGNAGLLTFPKPNVRAVLVALGGITPERLPTVHQYGFGAAALMGYLWAGKRPIQRLEACQAVVAELGKREGAKPRNGMPNER